MFNSVTIEIVYKLLSCLAILSAGGWFLYTTQFKRRIQFDLECKFIPMKNTPERWIAEINFIFENKGFVEHRMYNLNVSVHGLSSTEHFDTKDKTKELVFAQRLLERTNIVPKDLYYYFVRPNIRQVITHTCGLTRPGPVIRVTAGFDYDKSGNFPHTARRVFELPTIRKADQSSL